MKTVFRSTHGYRIFDQLVQRIELWAERNAPSAAGYTSVDIAGRIVQRVVEIGLNPFLQERARRFEQGLDPALSVDERIRCGELIMNAATGSVRPGALLLLRSFAEFLFHWLHVFLTHVRSCWRSLPMDSRPTTLLFGVGKENIVVENTDARFVEFCRKGPIAPITHAPRVIVQEITQSQSTDPETFSYARFPLFALVRSNFRGLSTLLLFFVPHLSALVSFIIAVFKNPLVIILGRDFAYHAMVSWLNHNGLIHAVVITNSNYAAQPLWMHSLPGRRYRTHMVWYSQNSIPFVYQADQVQEPFPYFKHIRVDETWVWTQGFADYLKRIGVAGIFCVVGPILWYLPESAADAPPGIRLVVFDVTPVRDNYARKIGLFSNYYTSSNLRKFLRDIVEVKTEIETHLGKKILISLKHKREYHNIHDPQYILFIRNEIQTRADCEIVSPQKNMFGLIAGSRLVIVIPYSSPAYVASSLGIPAVYYDPSGELLPTYEKSPHVSFASDRNALLKLIRSMIATELPYCREEAILVPDAHGS